ncbi:hypothetical protein BCR42DRAFT_425340 [Absidia repens]|uniref:Cation-transporting P-type ATPase N-terminal domain-containing protein n=1 Tax=Absidia repens TaxID=90262 RepID=A0A1X2I2S7_9FUNG|nr:hypothetical protein BCR42DRAFT_425340 [Absidia repens]
MIQPLKRLVRTKFPSKMDDSEYFAAMDFHKLTNDEVVQRFNTSEKLGLDTSAAETRLQRNGANVFAHRSPNYIFKTLGYIFGGFCSVLWIGVITFFLCWMPLSTPPITPGGSPSVINLALAILVIIVIFFQASFSAFQDWSTAKVMKSILNLLPAECLVVRNGTVSQITASDLVVGDIVHIKLGDKVPGDLRLLQVSNDLKFDRAVLTGESDAVEGSASCTDDNFLESQNIALMGTHVVNGNAVGVVVLTGNNTVMGRINKLTTAAKEKPTLIQQEISRFVRIIVCLTITLVLILVIEWAAFLHPQHPEFQNVVALLMNLMGCVVAFIPEGVPVGVAMTMMMVARKMKKNKVLPKGLTTVETLGCVNVICSDKTGTLTQNKMFVTSVGFGDTECTPDECRDTMTSGSSNPIATAYKQLHLASYFCNNSSFDASTNHLPVNERKVNGDATDSAILRFAATLGPEAPATDFVRTFEIPFNSKNKWMLSMYKAGSNPQAMVQTFGAVPNENEALVFVKGAPDILMPKCTSVLCAQTNTVMPLTPELSARLAALQEKWARNGQRVLVLCRRFYSPQSDPSSNAFQDEIVHHAVQDLTVLGLVGIMDPPRPEILQTIKDCRRSGSRFFMVTGDFGLTAAAIARQIGIFTCERDPETYMDVVKTVGDMAEEDEKFQPGSVTSLLLTGSDLLKFGDVEWSRVCRYEEIVFARTTPEQKLKIVKEFQKREFVVAVTGDGVNDAPALKAADVGVAVVSGSDVAIEAADLVLMGEFDSITEAIRLGRLVFQNLQKVIGYLLPAGSWSEIWPVLVNAFAGTPLPLTSFLMIMICCFTDLFPCLALIMENEEFDLLSMPPRNPKKDHLINLKIYFQSYLFMGSMQTICSLGMFFLYMQSATGLGWYDFVGTYSIGPWEGPDGNVSFGKDPQGNALSATDFQWQLQTGQCVTFVTLVILQWGNIMSVRNRRLSILQGDPLRAKRRNLWLFLGMLASLVTALIVTEVPWFNSVMQTAPVPVKHWFLPLPLAVGVIVMDDVRKLIVRVFPNSVVAKMAW